MTDCQSMQLQQQGAQILYARLRLDREHMEMERVKFKDYIDSKLYDLLIQETSQRDVIEDREYTLRRRQEQEVFDSKKNETLAKLAYMLHATQYAISMVLGDISSEKGESPSPIQQYKV